MGHQSASSGSNVSPYQHIGHEVTFDWRDYVSFDHGFNDNGTTIPETASADEVCREASARSDRIWVNFETLHRILQRHEAKIRERWYKKNTAQRLAILLDAWPDMPEVHRPDFAAFREMTDESRDSGLRHRSCFVWPYINQEDLRSEKVLPLLLNSRGHHLPSQFAAADYEAMRLGLVVHGFEAVHVNRHIMVLNGMTENSRDYGKLMCWDDHSDAFSWFLSHKQFMPGEGLLVLEAQDRLLDFLVKCSLRILHDIAKSAMIGDAYPILPEPQFQAESEITGFESLSEMAAEAPYRLPAKLNISRIESLLRARASAAEDHLWALREDVEYFSSTLLDAKEHRPEMLKDVKGNKHPLIKDDPQELLWKRIISSVVRDAYRMVETFFELPRLAGELVTLHERYASCISPAEDLPEEYLMGILRLVSYGLQTINKRSSKLKMDTGGSPPLRRLFIREPPPKEDPHGMMVLLKPDPKMDYVEKQLVWLLGRLGENGSQLAVAGMHVIVDELERLLQSEPRARKLLSPHVASVVGDISILSQCMSELLHYFPWARSWNVELEHREKALLAEFAERAKPWDLILKALWEKTISTEVVGLAKPSDGKLAYPVGRPHTKETVEALRRAEGHLNAFWTALDEMTAAKTGNFSGSLVVRKLLAERHILQRAHEWTEPENV